MASSAVVPQTLPADFAGWDKPSGGPPQTLPADFQGWDDAAPAVHSSVPVPGGLQGPPPAKLGSSLNDVGSVVGSHLKNMVAGPYHAAMDPARTPAESAIQYLGPGALALKRSFVDPTVNGIQESRKNFKAGNYDAGMQSAEDAIPIAGPWARGIENDVQQHGAVAGLAGLATDIAAPKAASKAVGLTAQGVGRGLQATSATPQSLKLAGTRAVTSGTPGQLLQDALKPGVKYGADFDKTLQDTIPAVTAADPTLKGVSGYANAADLAKTEQFGKYNNIMAPYRPLPAGAAGPVIPGSIHGAPIAQAQLGSIPAMDLVENSPNVQTKAFNVSAGPDGGTLKMAGTTNSGGIVNSTAAKAAAYNKPLSIPLADAIREDANAKLNSFYNKAGGNQNAALSSPETARVKAVGDTTRQLLYPKLESNAGLQPGTVAGIQDQFGKLSDVADVANKREPVFARHDPVTLSQKIAAAHGGPLATAFNYAKEKMLNSLTNSDALVNSAIDRYQNPNGTPLIARPGMIPQAGSAIGGAVNSLGGDISHLPVGINPLLYLRKKDDEEEDQ